MNHEDQLARVRAAVTTEMCRYAREPHAAFAPRDPLSINEDEFIAAAPVVFDERMTLDAGTDKRRGLPDIFIDRLPDQSFKVIVTALNRDDVLCTFFIRASTAGSAVALELLEIDLE